MFDELIKSLSAMCANAQDAGTHEGAIKAAQTRKAHGWGKGTLVSNGQMTPLYREFTNMACEIPFGYFAAHKTENGRTFVGEHADKVANLVGEKCDEVDGVPVLHYAESEIPELTKKLTSKGYGIADSHKNPDFHNRYNLFAFWGGQNPSTAQDAGTHEGAVKAAQTRKMHGGGSAAAEQTPAQTEALARHNALQKANWEEMASTSRMESGEENPYKYIRAKSKTDALMGKAVTPGRTQFYSKSNMFGFPEPGAKMHDANQAGARAAQREMDAQKRSLTM